MSTWKTDKKILAEATLKQKQRYNEHLKNLFVTINPTKFKRPAEGLKAAETLFVKDPIVKTLIDKGGETGKILSSIKEQINGISIEDSKKINKLVSYLNNIT